MRSFIAMYDDEIEKTRAKHQEFVEVIQAVEDDRLRNLLTLHYIDGLTWERVAEKMWYSTKHIFDLYRESLTAVYKILSERNTPPW